MARITCQRAGIAEGNILRRGRRCDRENGRQSEQQIAC